MFWHLLLLALNVGHIDGIYISCILNMCNSFNQKNLKQVLLTKECFSFYERSLVTNKSIRNRSTRLTITFTPSKDLFDDMKLAICISRCIDFVRDRLIRPFNAFLRNKDSLHSVWRGFLLIRKYLSFVKMKLRIPYSHYNN